MGLPFNITNPGILIPGLLTSAEQEFVTDLVLAGGTASENEVLTWKSGAPSWEPSAGGFSDPLTTNGDIIARIAGTTTRLAQGGNEHSSVYLVVYSVTTHRLVQVMLLVQHRRLTMLSLGLIQRQVS